VGEQGWSEAAGEGGEGFVSPKAAGAPIYKVTGARGVSFVSMPRLAQNFDGLQLCHILSFFPSGSLYSLRLRGYKTIVK
jgi:hypothetical protein